MKCFEKAYSFGVSVYIMLARTYVRITVGTVEQNARCLAAIGAGYDSAQAAGGRGSVWWLLGDGWRRGITQRGSLEVTVRLS